MSPRSQTTPTERSAAWLCEMLSFMNSGNMQSESLEVFVFSSSTWVNVLAGMPLVDLSEGWAVRSSFIFQFILNTAFRLATRVRVHQIKKIALNYPINIIIFAAAASGSVPTLYNETKWFYSLIPRRTHLGRSHASEWKLDWPVIMQPRPNEKLRRGRRKSCFYPLTHPAVYSLKTQTNQHSYSLSLEGQSNLSSSSSCSFISSVQCICMAPQCVCPTSILVKASSPIKTNTITWEMQTSPQKLTVTRLILTWFSWNLVWYKNKKLNMMVVCWN